MVDLPESTWPQMTMERCLQGSGHCRASVAGVWGPQAARAGRRPWKLHDGGCSRSAGLPPCPARRAGDAAALGGRRRRAAAPQPPASAAAVAHALPSVAMVTGCATAVACSNERGRLRRWLLLLGGAAGRGAHGAGARWQIPSAAPLLHCQPHSQCTTIAARGVCAPQPASPPPYLRRPSGASPASDLGLAWCHLAICQARSMHGPACRREWRRRDRTRASLLPAHLAAVPARPALVSMLDEIYETAPYMHKHHSSSRRPAAACRCGAAARRRSRSPAATLPHACPALAISASYRRKLSLMYKHGGQKIAAGVQRAGAPGRVNGGPAALVKRGRSTEGDGSWTG